MLAFGGAFHPLDSCCSRTQYRISVSPGEQRLLPSGDVVSILADAGKGTSLSSIVDSELTLAI